MKWMKWNSALVLGAVLCAQRSALVEGKIRLEDHPHIRGLVDLDRVPGLGQHRGLQTVCETACTQAGCPAECTCMGDEAVRFGDLRDPTTFGCTSNDVRVAETFVLNALGPDGVTPLPKQNGDFVCNDGDIINVQIEANLVNGASSSRSDIGIWLSNDGGDAESGFCSHFYFQDPGTGETVPLPNIDDNPPDTCGDLDAKQEAGPLPFIDTATGSEFFKVVCQSGGSGNLLTVDSCIGWKVPGADEKCDQDYDNDGTAGLEQDIIFGTLPATKSKCRCNPIELPIVVIRVPTITKTCTNGVILPAEPLADPPLPVRVQWTVTVAITNNNDATPLDNWEVTDSPLPFDSPLSSATEGSIAAGATLTAPRTITESIPSGSALNLGFTDTVTLSSTTTPEPEFPDITAEAFCPLVCEFTATCNLSPIEEICLLPGEIEDPDLVFDIGPLPCGELVLSSTDSSDDPCDGIIMPIVRTYTLLEDLNGNGMKDDNELEVTCTQAISILDNPPVLSAPADFSEQCTFPEVCTDTSGELGCPEVATATDDCGDATVTFSDETEQPCGTNSYAKTITRTWTATDSCDQTATFVQNIVVEDTTDPALSPLTDKTTECPDCLPDMDGVFAEGCFVTPTVTDACTKDVITPGSDIQNTQAQVPPCLEGIWTNTWTATDACGLTATTTQAITVDDSIAPVIDSCPTDGSVDLCSDVNLGAPPQTLAVTDQCGSPDATLVCCFDSANDESLRTWSVTDNCGNVGADCVQTIGISTTTCGA